MCIFVERHNRLERHNNLFLFFQMASQWVTCWNFTVSRKVFQIKLRCDMQLQINLWFRSFSREIWCVFILFQPFGDLHFCHALIKTIYVAVWQLHLSWFFFLFFQLTWKNGASIVNNIFTNGLSLPFNSLNTYM